MLGPPIDAWYVWLAASVAALAVLGVATSATPPQPSQAEDVAEVVDTVAASRAPASGSHPIRAERLRVDGHRIVLVGDEERVAIVRRGPVTPAGRGTRLRDVALGSHPAEAYDSPAAFRAAATAARAEARTVQAGDEVVVRAVRWGDVRVTIVTA